MASPEFRDLVRSRWLRFGKRNPPDPLGVALVGPGLTAENDLGYRKRHQIKEVLSSEGHNAFCPEDVATIDPQVPIIEQEPHLLGDVDLIFILHMENSPDVEVQIHSFASDPVLVAKTVILFPRNAYYLEGDHTAERVAEFPMVKPYDEDALVTCAVVEEFTRLASTREWYGWANRRFIRF